VPNLLLFQIFFWYLQIIITYYHMYDFNNSYLFKPLCTLPHATYRLLIKSRVTYWFANDSHLFLSFFEPMTFIFFMKCLCQVRKVMVTYVRVRGTDFASIYTILELDFWNCSDSIVFYFHFNTKWNSCARDICFN
jgi:hypothetical protein